MKRIPILPLIIFLIIVSVFFYPIFKGQIPFPGDLLVGENAPYNSLSYGEYGPGGVPNKAQGPDVIYQMFPWRYFSVTSLLSGNIPFWNSHQFAGNPHMANFQSSVFYPLNLLFSFDFKVGWTLFIVVIPLLSSFFMFLFLREQGVSKVASLFGGVVFAFSSYMVVWMEYGNIGHTMLWLPLVLLLTDKLLRKVSIPVVLILELSLFFAFLAGYIQGYFYIVVVAFLYFIYKKFEMKKSFFLQVIVFGILLTLPVFLGAFQLLPTLQIFSLSTRGSYSLLQIQHLLNPIWYSITTIAPDFFGNPASRNFWFDGTYIERVSYFGVIPFIFALCAALFVKKKTVTFFTFLSIGVFFLVTDIAISKYFYLLPIPVLSTTVPTRMLSIFVFAGSILSSFGLDYVLHERHKKVIIPPVVVLGIILFAIGILIIGNTHLGIDSSQMRISLRNVVLPLFLVSGLSSVIVFLVFLRKYVSLQFRLKIAIVFIFGLTLFELFYFFHKITPFSPTDYVYPQTPVVSYLRDHADINRFWGYGAGYLKSNFQTVDGTYSPDGNDPLHSEFYTDFLATSKDGRVPTHLSRTDANIAPGFGSGELNGNKVRQKVLNLLGVKYLVHKNEIATSDFDADDATFDPKTFKLLWQNGQWQVYENLHVAPRAFLTTSYELVKDKKQLFKRFYAEDFDVTNSILLYDDPHIPVASIAAGSVDITSYSDNNVTMNVKTKQRSLLFLSDTFYPEWRATIDGEYTPIYRADHAFRSIVVPEGEHKIAFSYYPKKFYSGLLISATAIILLGMLLFILRKRPQLL